MKTNKIEPAWCPKVLNLKQIPGAFFEEAGYSRPDWKVLANAIENDIPPEDRGIAWSEAVTQWLLEVRANLGGEYSVRHSKEFALLSELDEEGAEQLLGFAEETLASIYHWLKDAAWRWGCGAHVIFLFSEEDDYCRYLSFFDPNKNWSINQGYLLEQDYVHMVISKRDGTDVRRAVAHELAHNSLVHLILPIWLDEGLAALLERPPAEWRPGVLNDDLRSQFLRFWNSGNIQAFWAGVSFYEPESSIDPSYRLAESAVSRLLEREGEYTQRPKPRRSASRIRRIGTAESRTVFAPIGEQIRWRKMKG